MTVPAAHEETAVNSLLGETLFVLERVIVAPTAGVFRPLEARAQINNGEMVNQGDVIGIVRSLGTSTPVLSPFDGVLVAILAVEGERVRPGQPVAWVRVA